MEMKMAQSSQRVYPSYDVMIQQLFKPMATVQDQIMHAAIGISGEVAELLTADSMTNVIEECGDVEFYIEALKQQFTPTFISVGMYKLPFSIETINLGNVFTNMVIVAGELLDLAKKTWAYTKPLDEPKMTYLIMVLEVNLEKLYEMVSILRDDVKMTNQIKLIGPGGRFESGFYSDGAAIARADKTERKFIGQKP